MQFILSAIVLAHIACTKSVDRHLLDFDNKNTYASYIQVGSSVNLNGKEYPSNNSIRSIPITLTKPAPSSDTIIAKINLNLINDYNQRYTEHNSTPPLDAFTVNSGVFPVKAGATSTTDSISVLLSDASKLNDKSFYLIPIELTVKGKSKLLNNIIYFKFLINKGFLTARFTGATYQNFIRAAYGFGSLRLNYDRIQKKDIPSIIKFGVTSNFKFNNSDVTTSMEYVGDDPCIAYGNKLLTGSNPQPFPLGTYEITKNSLNIPQGSITSNDSLIINITNKDRFKSGVSYVLGFQMKQTNDSNSVKPAENDSSKVYVRIWTF